MSRAVSAEPVPDEFDDSEDEELGPAVDLSTTLAGVGFPNPIFTASGCAAAGRELAAFFDVADLGAVVTKSVMRDPALGRADPADGRDPERDAQLDRPAGPGHHCVPGDTTCPGSSSTAPGRS